jgi:hypothetical protein
MRRRLSTLYFQSLTWMRHRFDLVNSDFAAGLHAAIG